MVTGSRDGGLLNDNKAAFLLRDNPTPDATFVATIIMSSCQMSTLPSSKGNSFIYTMSPTVIEMLWLAIGNQPRGSGQVRGAFAMCLSFTIAGQSCRSCEPCVLVEWYMSCLLADMAAQIACCVTLCDRASPRPVVGVCLPFVRLHPETCLSYLLRLLCGDTVPQEHYGVCSDHHLTAATHTRCIGCTERNVWASV